MPLIQDGATVENRRLHQLFQCASPSGPDDRWRDQIPLCPPDGTGHRTYRLCYVV